MNEAIAQMDESTQQNAALVEEAAAAAQSLQDQASNLAQVVSVFKLNDLPQAKVVATPVVPMKPPAAAGKPVLKSVPATDANVRKLANARVASGDDWEEF